MNFSYKGKLDKLSAVEFSARAEHIAQVNKVCMDKLYSAAH
jgi:hypothetical protein